MTAVDAGLIEPRAVAQVVEVLANRRHEHGLVAEGREPEGDVGSAAAAPDVEVVHEERQGELVELVGDERIREFALKGHEMVGRNRACYSDMHGNRLDDPLRDVSIAKGIGVFLMSHASNVTRVKLSGTNRRRRTNWSPPGCRS